MTNTNMDKYSAGFGLSVAVTSLVNALILLAKETNTAIMDAMKAAAGHHWTTHGIIVLAVFVILGFVFSGMKIEEKIDSSRMLRYIIWGVVIGVAVIAGFFLPNLKAAGVPIKY